ncbi:MAG TPA: hypothetical protein VGI39_08525 [Polyangiaceae bacterium]
MKRPGLVIVLAASLVYVVWIGVRWVPAEWTGGELAACAARVWDLRHELDTAGTLPWWTPRFLGGSSNTMLLAGAEPAIPWLLFSYVTSLRAAGKLDVLLAVFASGPLMYACARELFVTDETTRDRAAALAALAFLLHPGQLARALDQEFFGAAFFTPFVPLVWLLFARALDTGSVRSALLCALAATGMLWAQTKQALVQAPFLVAYAVFVVARADREARLRAARGALGSAVAAALFSAFLIVPPLVEMKHYLLFEGSPFGDWQLRSSLRDVLALVQRDPGTASYAGLPLLVIGGYALLAVRDATQRLAFFGGAFGVSVAVGHGPRSVLAALAPLPTYLRTAWEPIEARAFAVLALAAFAVFLVVLARRRLTGRALLVALPLFALATTVPLFRLFEPLPLFRMMRAPVIFYEIPGMFCESLLVGFAALALPRALASRWPLVLAACAALFALDAWPYQAHAAREGASPATMRALTQAYASLGARARPGEKVYVMSHRAFHALGPSFGGPPVADDPTFVYMAPRFAGLLARESQLSVPLERAYFDADAVRWVVYDKTDAATSGELFRRAEDLRAVLPVAYEDADFVFFENDSAHAFVRGYAHACLGEDSPRAALDLWSRDCPLVTELPEGLSAAREPDPLALDHLARPSSSRIDLDVRASRPTLAVLAENYHPYWRVEVDGAPAPVVRAGYAFLAVRVPPGSHAIRFVFTHPPVAGVALGVSAIALALALGYLALSRRKRAR